MLSFYISCLAVAGVVTAQSRNQSVDLYIPGDNTNNNLAASVVSVKSDIAVYAVGCVSGAVPASATANRVKRQQSSAQPNRARTTSEASPDDGEFDDSSECGFPTPITITQGPSTLKFAYAISSASLLVDCKLAGTDPLTQAVCTGTQNGLDASESGVETATLNGTDLPQGVAVRVTAGAEKLSALSTGADTTTTAQSSGATGKTGLSAGSGTITPAASAGSVTSSAPAPTTSNAGAVRVPGARRLAMCVLGVGMALFLL